MKNWGYSYQIYIYYSTGTVENKSEITDQIDDIVDSHDIMQKRILGSILEKGSDILKGLAGHVSNLWGKAKEVAGKVRGR